MFHAEITKLMNEELPEGVIVYLEGEREYRITYTSGHPTIRQEAERKEAIKRFIAEHNGVITSGEKYYCIIAKFAE